MGKISLVSAKYIIHASIDIKGAVDRPDVIGAIFGQTEGLLGSDLELRELQKSGRIGRIEVNVETHSGRTTGNIIIPSSLDKSETSIVGAALEVIERIGPCESKIKVERIEDVRISKREFVLDRAKELLKQLQEEVLPESDELAEEVAHSIRQMEIQEYGKDRLPAGPEIAESEEIIVVEGRADVLNLLKHGIKNAIAMNGTSVPETIIRLSKSKIMSALVDGDRGGDLIIKELQSVADLDSYSKAPSGKEVEELTKKEVFTVLSSKITLRQNKNAKKIVSSAPDLKEKAPAAKVEKKIVKRVQKTSLTAEEKTKFKQVLEELIGSRAAVIFDANMDVLGKVPVAELSSTIKNIEGIYAVVFDGEASDVIVDAAEKTSVNILVGMDAPVKSAKVNVFSVSDL
ncbi:DNA primase [Candidatus Woesearchaeota archaeon]|nr:DNA primase [Candidatus Woesearchaeota archaeon]MBW3016962.1 DNA primase [Candidatus Woesearchaeota archaeon]